MPSRGREVLPVPRAGSAQVVIESSLDPVQVRQESLVLRQRLEPLLGDEPQHEHRVVVGRLPEVPVEAAEQTDGLVIPGPAQVVGQGLEPREPRGHPRSDVERADGSHVSPPSQPASPRASAATGVSSSITRAVSRAMSNSSSVGMT